VGAVGDVNDIARFKNDIRGFSTDDVVVIHNGNFRIVHGAADDADVAAVGSGNGAARFGNGGGEGAMLTTDSLGHADGAEDVNIAGGGGGEINEVVGLKVNVLGHIAAFDERFEINGETFAVADDEALAEVS